jgi:sulfotransferase
MGLNFNLCAISGLPRSGSTLVAAIFNQHPNVHIEGTSGLGNLIADTTESIFNTEKTAGLFLKANNRADYTHKKIVPAMVNAFYSDVKKPFVIDKSRAWTDSVILENVESVVDKDIKVLILIRPIEEIIASFAALVDEDQRTDAFYNDFFTQAAPIKDCFTHILKVVNSGKSNICVKTHLELIQNPAQTINEIRKFFGLSNFEYSFFGLSKYAPEDDSVYPPYKNLHALRNGVSQKKIDFVVPEGVLEKASKMSDILYKFTCLTLKGETNGTFC